MTMTARFAGTCKACHHGFPVGTLVEWTRGVGARHVAGACPTTPPPAPASRMVVRSVAIPALLSIVEFLAAAHGRGLRYPKARFLAPGGGELLLKRAGNASAHTGAVNVLVAGEWVGRINLDGTVVGRLAGRSDLMQTLAVIATDPAGAAKSYGALHCHCSFCGLPLTDAGSVAVGYGPVCADHWGLPHTPLGTPAVTQHVAQTSLLADAA